MVVNVTATLHCIELDRVVQWSQAAGADISAMQCAVWTGGELAPHSYFFFFVCACDFKSLIRSMVRL